MISIFDTAQVHRNEDDEILIIHPGGIMQVNRN